MSLLYIDGKTMSIKTHKMPIESANESDKLDKMLWNVAKYRSMKNDL